MFASRWQPGVLRTEVRRHQVPIRPRPDALAATQYRRRAARALEAAGPMAHGAFSALSPLGGVFWVPSVHRVAYDLALSRRGSGAGLVQRLNPYHRLRLRLEREILSPGGYSHLLAAAEQVKADVVERYGVPEEDVTVQPLGFDPVAFNAERRRALREQARAELGLSRRGPGGRVRGERARAQGLRHAAGGCGRLEAAGGRQRGRVGVPVGEGRRERQRRHGDVRGGRRVRAAHPLRAVGARDRRGAGGGAAGRRVAAGGGVGGGARRGDGRAARRPGGRRGAGRRAAADARRRLLEDDVVAASVAHLSWPSVAREYAAVLAAH